MSNTAPFFTPLSINGQIYDFQHLEPFTMSFHSQMASRNLRVNVRFSNHCFTHSPLDHTVYAPETILTDHGNYVNDPAIIGLNDNQISINTTLEVDLTGQCCSESIGSTQFSGTGGQSDTAGGVLS